MTEKRSFNLDALEDALERDNAILLGSYDKVNKRSRINFKCNCGQEYNKVCLEIVSRAGAFCKECTTNNSINKLHSTLKGKKGNVICTLESLHNIIQRDNAELIEDYNAITINSIINFRCNCGEISSKNCLQLIKVSGAYCKECTRTTWAKRIKETNMTRYGVECTVHASHIKHKIWMLQAVKVGIKTRDMKYGDIFTGSLTDLYGARNCKYVTSYW